MSAAKKTAGLKVDDCWKRIGVWGDRQCPQLTRCQHCCNCEVYSQAGRQLLNRSIPEGYVQAWTKLLAEPEVEILPGRVSILIFRLGPEWFALPANLFSEVLEIRDVHSIPHRTNPILLGLLNVRGEMQLCVSVGKLLGVDKDIVAKEVDDSRTKPRILLFSMRGECLAFHVSEACCVHIYHPSEIQPLPATLSREASAYSKGLLCWNDRHVSVLDEDMLFEKLIGSIQ